MPASRILHVASQVDIRSGGLAMALRGMITAQRVAGLEVSLLATFQDGESLDIVAPLTAQGVTVTTVGPAWTPLRWHPALPQHVDGALDQCDVVHIHGVWEQVQFLAAQGARRRGVPYVLSPHGMLDRWSMAQKPLKKWLYSSWRLTQVLQHAAAIHFTTTVEQEAQIRRAGGPGLVEPLGIDLGEFSPLPPLGAFRARYPETAGRPLVLFLGRLHYKKGLDLLVSAFARCHCTDALLVLAGPDEHGYGAQVARLARAHGVAERVLFPGPQYGQQRLEAFRDAFISVLPSHQENFGISVVESLAAGTPVVISDQVALHREIAPAGVGSVVPLDPMVLAETMDAWLADPVRRDQVSARAIQFARERFSWDSVGARWPAHYAAILKGMPTS